MRRYLLIAAGLLALLSPAKAADSTVTLLTAASALGGTELLYVVQGAADRKGTPAQVATYVYSLMSGDCTVAASVITCAKINGNTFPSSGTSGGIPYWSGANAVSSSAALTANLPVIGGGAGAAPAVGTRSGNTTAFVTTTGTQTSGDCVKIDANGNHIANGSACGSGGSGTVTSIATSCGATGGTITATGTISSQIIPRAATGTTDTILAGDCGGRVTESNASPVAVTLPQATGSFTTGWFTEIVNLNTGLVTVTPTTSTIDGVASITLAQFQSIVVVSDGTNYSSARGRVPNGLFTVTGALKGSGAGVVTQAACADLSNAGALCPVTPGTGVATAAAAALSAAGGLTSTIAAGTSALGTSAIGSAACASVVTTAATNTATTDVVSWGFNGDPTGVTGYTPVTTGALTIFAYPSANNVNFKVCNLTSASITPGAITLNWRIAR